MKIFLLFLGLTTGCLVEALVECHESEFHNLDTDAQKRERCGPAFKNLCFCHMACYDGTFQHIVNCTNSNFNNTDALSHLPDNTSVLIFTGNHLETLSLNLFGLSPSYPKLRVIDMSNNNINEIHGKTFHHVSNVVRLILDFNEISLDPGRSHPRLFSNFLSLKELHLTDAFEDGHPRDLASILHEIFVNSNLTHLIKLHLEQNEISEFKDSNVFCDLPDLMDLHLGDNKLTGLQFNLSCLHKLRFLDLQRNKFKRVLERDMYTLDTFAKHGQNVTVDFSNNPFECGCELNPFIRWMNKTKVFVRNKQILYCTRDLEKDEFKVTESCSLRLGTTVALSLLSMILVALVASLIYLQRADLRKRLEPVIDSVSKRVRYTSIATGEMREMDV